MSTLATITLRPAAPHDEDSICQLFGALHAYNAALDPRFALAEGWEQVLHAHLQHVWDSGHGLTLLAWDGALPVGLALWSAHSDSPLFRHRHWAELVALYVVPEARGQGLAARLLDAGLAWAREQGYARVQLYATASNHAARRFYARQGFRPVQEVWRRELGAREALPPVDELSLASYAHGHDLLSISSHPLAADPYRETHPPPEEEPMLEINPLGTAGRAPSPHAATVKGWVVAAFDLPDSSAVLVTELRCLEPGCPPLETVIAILDGPGHQRQFKLHKALADINHDDIAALVGATDPSR